MLNMAIPQNLGMIRINLIGSERLRGLQKKRPTKL